MLRAVILIGAVLATTPAGAKDRDGVPGPVVTSSPVVTAAPTADASVQNSNLNLVGSLGNATANTTFQEAASSAASIYASRCTAGASGQGMGGGASVAVSNPLCDVIMMYSVAEAACQKSLGFDDHACGARDKLFDDAMELASAAAGPKNWRAKVRKYMPAIINWMF